MYCVSKIAKIAIKSFSLDEILLFYFFTKYAREKARAGNVINSLWYLIAKQKKCVYIRFSHDLWIKFSDKYIREKIN
jgi:hypothetical protein